jgi:hypothetical protein
MNHGWKRTDEDFRCGNLFRMMTPVFAILLILQSGQTALRAQQVPFQVPTPPQVDATAQVHVRPRLSITEHDVRPHVMYLASPELQGRGKNGRPLASTYIHQSFVQAGLKPLFPNGQYFQPIPGAPDLKGERTVQGHNVAGILPGSDPLLTNEVIIISAHYDHLGINKDEYFPGADDNASGVAMLLEVAKQLSQRKLARSVIFVAFDLEERGLIGSRWFLAHPPCPREAIKYFMTADMIGRSLGGLDLPVVFIVGSERSPEVRPMLSDLQIDETLEYALMGVDLIGTRSDYGAFRDADIPFLFFSTGEHPDYHTKHDTPDKIEYGKLASISEMMGELVISLANAPVVPTWTDKPQTGMEEVDLLLRVTNELVKPERAGQLGATQKFFVSQAHNYALGIKKRGHIKDDERRFLIRSAQMLMFTVF